MGSDDDTIIIRGKARMQAALQKPVTSLKRWHVAAIALVAFVAGALIF